MVKTALPPVLIAGAGPTGMTAALELTRCGVPVRIFDQAAMPAQTSRAIGVQARTLELLQQRGLADALIAQGNPGMAVNIYGGGKRLFKLDFGGIDSQFNYILLVSQAQTEKLLRDALAAAGISIERPRSLVALAQSERGGSVTAVIDNGGVLAKVTGAYLISAEGAHSIARATCGLEFKGESFVEDYILGDLAVEGDIANSELHVFSSERGLMALFPLGGCRFRLIASNPLSKPSADEAPSIMELQRLYDQRSTVPVQFRDLTWSSWFRINSRMVDRLRVGRVFFGGDSAHIHSPAGGQGMNTGIQDMMNLAWKMAMVIKGQAKAELLDTYDADRLPIIRDVLSNTETLTHAIGNENPIFRSVFNHIAPWIVNVDLVRHGATERMSQLSLNYRHSPLSVSATSGGHLHPGDRMPDLCVRVVERSDGSTRGEEASILRLIDPVAFTLLHVNVIDPSALHAAVAAHCHHRGMVKVRGIAAARDQTAFDKMFGTDGAFYLVRPDGYLAFKAAADAIDEFGRFCNRWLLPPAEPL